MTQSDNIYNHLVYNIIKYFSVDWRFTVNPARAAEYRVGEVMKRFWYHVTGLLFVVHRRTGT